MVSTAAAASFVGSGRGEDAGKLLLRVTIAVLMLFHGIAKLVGGISGIMGLMERIGLPGFVAYGVFLSQIVAPIFILLGLWTRPAAVLYAGTIVFATLLAHPTDYVRVTPAGGWAAELWLFYILGAVAVALLGAGRYSLRGGKPRWD